jgi:DNA-binding CsgD family transcriptional regulator
MVSLPADTWKRVTEASRLMHAHGHGELSSRLFEAASMLFENTCCAFEIYGRDGSHLIWENVPFPEARRAEIRQRIGEVVPFEHPAFPHLLEGRRESMRISDLMSQRALRKTHLYNEIFREAEVQHQIVIPIHVSNGIGGMTLNRGGADYSDEDLFVASVLAPHLVTAYESNLLLSEVATKRETKAKLDYTELRELGLTRRESEVMSWMVEGKRDGEIATILNISVRTANVHVRNILTKLGVETRTTAVARVMNEGLL